MSLGVDPEQFGRTIAPLLAAEADPCPTGLTEDDTPTTLNPYFRERFFHRVYGAHDGFPRLELAAKDDRTLDIYAFHPDGSHADYVFIKPGQIPRLTGRLERHSGNRWNYYRVQVTEQRPLRDLELNAHPSVGVRLVDVERSERRGRREWGSVTVDPACIPAVIAGLEQAYDELAD